MEMKKKILIGILCSFVLLITACNNNKLDVDEVSNIVTSNEKVSLTIKEGSLSSTKATLILENNSTEDLGYSDSYEIEIKKDNDWYKINVDIGFNEPLYIIEPNQSQELDINWENGYGSLTPGEYRIIKDVMLMDNDDTYEDFYIAAEFTIEKQKT